MNGKSAQTAEKEMDSKEKSLGLEGLMARVNATGTEVNRESGDQDDPRMQRRNADRRHGYKRFEVLVKVSSITQFISNLFGGKRT